MANFSFLTFGMAKLLKTLSTVSDVKINVFQIRIFEGITLLLFIIYGFIKIKVLSTMLFFRDSGKFLDFSKQRLWVRAPVSAESGNNLPYLGKPDTFYKRLQVGVNSFIP